MRAVEYCFTTSLNYSKLIVQLKRSCLRHNYHTIRYGQSCAVEPQNAEDLQSPLREDTRPLQEVNIFFPGYFSIQYMVGGRTKSQWEPTQSLLFNRSPCKTGIAWPHARVRTGSWFTENSRPQQEVHIFFPGRFSLHSWRED